MAAASSSGQGPHSRRSQLSLLPQRALGSALCPGAQRQPDRAEQTEQECQRTEEAQLGRERDGTQARQVRIARHIEAADEGAGTECDQRHDHPDAAAANRVQGAGAAAAAQLHAETEQRAPDRDLNARRRHGAADPLPEDLTYHQERREQQHGEAEHDELREHARHVALDDRPPIGRGEAEGSVIEAHAEQRADHQERAVAPALAPECQRAEAEQQAACHDHMPLLPDRSRLRVERDCRIHRISPVRAPFPASPPAPRR
jgi:hypothetical protein